MPKFGVQRLVRPDIGFFQRLVFRLAGVADPAHFLHNRYLQQALNSRHSFSPRRILDAGCGTGDHTIYLAQRFPNASVLGVDVDSDRIERNRRSAAALGITNVTFEVADLTLLSYSEQFDLIVSIDVLEHIVEQRRAIETLARLLSVDGLAFFHVPTIRTHPVPFSRHLHGFHAWAEEEHVAEDLTPEVFAGECERSGLRVTRLERTFGWWTGELATSLFALPYRNTPLNRILQLALILPCRCLAIADSWHLDDTRYAALVLASRRT